MKKIIDAYKRYEHFPNYRAPEFSSNATEFHVTLWNLNYEQFTKEGKEFTKEGKEFTKEGKEFTKELAEDGVLLPKARKEFLNAQRKIYRYISEKPDITTQQMAERMGITKRQVLRYIKRLTSMNLIAREGGRKMGVWRITDEDYESFFDKSSKEDE